MDPSVRSIARSAHANMLTVARTETPAYPSLAEVEKLIIHEKKGNCVPVYVELPADLLTPYPFKIIKVGPNEEIAGDPMAALQKELSLYQYVKIPEIPTFTAVPSVMSRTTVSNTLSQDYSHTKRPISHSRAVFMLVDTLLVYDHIFQSLKTAVSKARRLAKLVVSSATPEIPQPPITLGAEGVSNVGKAGYEQLVTTLKEHIVAGDIIQAVPSQRLARPTALHPFNAYRHLRKVNPSPYMFYLDCGDLQIVGASPETLCKVEKNVVFNHVSQGRRSEEGHQKVCAATDEKLGAALLASEKDRAEHIMLVDLARNDVNRVCEPCSVKVDHLMRLEKFSHVIHLTSQVSGTLREGLTRGAQDQGHRNYLFLGERTTRRLRCAVGRFDFAADEMDTCIAIRTMVFKEGVAYLQAGGGIVFDSVEEDEYVETINKLKGNVRALEEAERKPFFPFPENSGPNGMTGYWHDLQNN
ncbi:anthranilate synthase component [Salix suchowensis]|nr:anthranilate synthase component [Salix suchowensis]